MLSIIIPAYNEEKLIVNTLEYLLADQHLSHCKIIVVCNGCSDNTAYNVSTFQSLINDTLTTRSIDLILIDDPKASKTNAMNIGLNYNADNPIVFIDADILISGKTIIELTASLNDNVLAASPKINFKYQESSWVVRAYYKVASHSNYNHNNRLSNVIALSAKGLAKLNSMPEVIADDEYIRRSFHVSEYLILQHVLFDFICPKTLGSLLNVLTRVERGNIQLNALNYKDKSEAITSGFRAFNYLLFPVFILCKLYAKFRAKKQYENGRITQWERDESNR